MWLYCGVVIMFVCPSQMKQCILGAQQLNDFKGFQDHWKSVATLLQISVEKIQEMINEFLDISQE